MRMKAVAQRFVPMTLVVLLAVAMPGTQPAAAQQARSPLNAEPEPLVQERVLRQRPRARIRVQPQYPYRRFHTTYPLPYAVEYPGPGARRACVSRMVTEHRLSGTVIVPRMHCWWVRG